MLKWYENALADASPVISSRVRLARNIAKYPFHTMLSDEAATQMMQEVAHGVFNTPNPLAQDAVFFNLGDLSETERRMMFETHTISHALSVTKKPAGLIKHADDAVSVMLNEEDHVRIQCVAPGDQINAVWAAANQVDDAIESHSAYAFHKDFGYLTACPTNTGTGLRASFMVHLPMLEGGGQLRNIIPAMGKFGMTVRGMYGEGTEPLGSVYQISNQLTLGKREQEITEALQNVAKQVIDHEQRLFEEAIKADKAAFEDDVYRSYGVLSHTRKISSKEAMRFLSAVRLGYMSGVLTLKRPAQTIYSIILACQPGSLGQNHNAKDEQTRDIRRADYLRQIFA